jgi:hypothetical protein
MTHYHVPECVDEEAWKDDNQDSEEYRKMSDGLILTFGPE